MAATAADPAPFHQSATSDPYPFRPPVHPRRRRRRRQIRPISIQTSMEEGEEADRLPMDILQTIRRHLPISIQTSMKEGEEADRLPMDILQTIRRHLPIVDYLRFPAVCTAWRCASRYQGNLPHLPRGAPWLFALSYSGTILYAIDCLSTTPAKVYRLPLPDHLHGCQLFSSIGHSLLLEDSDSLSGIRLFNPFSPPSSPPPPSLPPSASLMPPSCPSPYHLFNILTIVTRGGIALALPSPSGLCRLAYTMLDCNSSGSWIDLTDLISDPCLVFGSAAPYKDGLFCVVDIRGNKAFSLDFSSSPTVTLSDFSLNLPDNYSPRYQVADWCSYQSARLVTSGSSLFLVRWRNILNKDGVKKRREIDVYRLDDHDGLYTWVPVKSLGHLSFFIGLYHSFSMSPVDFPDLSSNRIYLPLDARSRIAGNEFSCDCDDDPGYHLVYSLVDESWGVFYHDASQPHTIHPSPDAYPSPLSVWMVPHAV